MSNDDNQGKQTLVELLEALPAERNRGVSSQLESLAPAIDAALSRGVGRLAICEALASQGIKTTPSTLSTLISRLRKRTQQQRKTK